MLRSGSPSSQAPGTWPENALPPGTQLGEFEIRGVIGEGGFGIVYLAYDGSLHRMVALKEFMPSGMASRTQALQVTVRSRQHVETFSAGLKSFVGEARLLARFDSPSLVKVYRFWEANGTAYMVMPFYEGVTLRQSLREGRVDANERWLRAMLVNLFDAVETIHGEHCYHRDIAPDNILILKDGRPLLLDFGAARRVIGDTTRGLTVILKPGFAPIEQYADSPGMKQGPWTDIYALGAVAYFVITGTAPPPSAARIVGDEMLPAREAGRGRYSENLLDAIDHALAVHPSQRIQNVSELRKALAEESGPRTMPGAVRTIGKAAGAAAVQPPRIEPQLRTWPPSLPPGSTTANPGDRHTMGQPEPKAGNRSRTGWAMAGVAGAAVTGAALFAYLFGSATGEEAGASDARSSTEVAAAGPSVSGPAQPSPPPSAPPAAPRASVPSEPASASVQGPVPPAPAPLPDPQATSPPSRSPAPGTDTSPPPAAAGAANPSVALAPGPGLSPEDEFWRGATMRDTAAAYEAYLRRYPRGRHADAARMMLEARQTRLAAAPAPAAAPVPPATAPRAATAPTPPGAGSAPADAAPASARPFEPAPSQITVTRPPPLLPAAPGAREQVSPAAPSRTEAAPPNLVGSAPAAAAVPPPPAASPAAPTAAPAAPRVAAAPGPFARDPATGALSGNGQITYPNGDRFEGRMVNGSKEGKGTFEWANGQRYSGEWAGDVPHGQGTMRFASGHVYTGEWVKGKQHGKGEFVWANGQRYQGEWSADQPHGEGSMRFTNGDVYTGRWVNGHRQGRGQFVWANGQRYTGDFAADEPHGQGSMRFVSGDTYTGSWVKGRHHGHGKYLWPSGTFWEGEFRDGKKTDNGKTVFADGRSVDGPGIESAGGPPAEPARPVEGNAR
ncbi:protein kinase domain-containing protein [Ramlibacter aurantiacus]|uniref:protein kinase domain-containing protein n=1 Tax=Ramlibacter aurantiacus TaxID=2801330 RepID=UPI00338FFCD5